MTFDPSLLRVRFASPSDYEQINALFNLTFGLNRSMEQFRWKFLETPWISNMPVAVVCTYEGALIGSYGLTPHRLLVDGKSIQAIQVLDVCVHPEYWRYGINRAAFTFFWSEAQQFGEIAFGFPGQVYAEVGMLKLGHHRLTGINTYATYFDSRPVAASDFGGLSVDVSDQVPSQWPDLMTARSAIVGLCTEKSLDYLQWRFEQHRSRRAIFFTAQRDNSTEAIAIARAVSVADKTSIWIYHLLFNSTPALQLIVDQIWRTFQDHNPVEMIYWCSESVPEQHQLELAGFQRVTHGLAVAVFKLFGEKDSRHDWISTPPPCFFELGDTDL